MMLQRWIPAAVLAAVFVGQVVVAGVSTAWSILRPGVRPQPALLRIGYEGLSPFGAAMLACLVTLTPGTTAIDLDLEGRELLLHVLDGDDARTAAEQIHRRFERRLRVVFPEVRA
jgi:multicomponent K+:H+ antiporter subunit E/multicomponent Na+:H+ antiporter subunit E